MGFFHLCVSLPHCGAGDNGSCPGVESLGTAGAASAPLKA